MDYLLIALISLLAAGLTLFSGFGLGTILMPIFALFFPIPVAVAATAVVHLANNIFKVILVGRKADWSVVIRFALPAALFAVLGAFLLNILADSGVIASYRIGDAEYSILWVKMIIGITIILFALLDLLPGFKDLSFERKWLPLGGIFSGFFGGLSGNQGALRSAFLIRAGLSKEAFIGTGTVSAVIVDISRLIVYGFAFYSAQFQTVAETTGWLVLTAVLFAFLGSFFGSRIMKKVTLDFVKFVVGFMLICIGILMCAGIV